VQRVTAAQAVADRLLAMIRGGSLRPGDQLPTERELADRLAVGRSSVREAMQVLATLNVVEARPGAGTFVRRPRFADFVTPETLSLLALSTRALELLEAREMIEPPTARLAAMRGTEEDFAVIEGLLDRHERAMEAGLQVTEHAARFHVLVAEASHNRIATTFMESILGVLTARGRRIDGNRIYALQDLTEHRAILAVLRERDAERAAENMLDHIVRSAATYDTHEDQEETR
jgi:GntR family transcriptional regulator, transcriptional repressor for pyruvate dehydrogenase complex